MRRERRARASGLESVARRPSFEQQEDVVDLAQVIGGVPHDLIAEPERVERPRHLRAERRPVIARTIGAAVILQSLYPARVWLPSLYTGFCGATSSTGLACELPEDTSLPAQEGRRAAAVQHLSRENRVRRRTAWTPRVT
jgi:hypothetical protein